MAPKGARQRRPRYERTTAAIELRYSTDFAGYPGFHPPRPGQDEDVLTDANVKQGFQLGQQVIVSALVIRVYYMRIEWVTCRQRRLAPSR